MWNPFRKKSLEKAEVLSEPESGRDDGAARARVTRLSWRRSPDGSVAVLDLPPESETVATQAGGTLLDGRPAAFARRAARANRMAIGHVVVTPEASAEGLGSVTTAASDAFLFEAARRLGAPESALLWGAGGAVRTVPPVGKLLAGLDALEPVEDDGDALPHAVRIPFRLTEGDPGLAGWATRSGVGRATTFVLTTELPIRRRPLEVLSERLAARAWAGLHPLETPGDLLVLVAAGTHDAPPVERWDDPRMDALEAGLALLLEGLIGLRSGRNRRVFDVSDAASPAEALGVLRALWGTASAAFGGEDAGAADVLMGALARTAPEGFERRNVTLAADGEVLVRSGDPVAGAAKASPRRIVLSLGRGRASVRGYLAR